MKTPPDDLLLQLLEDERDILLSGDLSLLEDTTERKINLAKAIADRAVPVPAPRMRELAEAAQRNAKLSEAAHSGLRGAMERLSERARIVNSLQTYDRDGNRRVHHTSPARLERRS